MTAPDKPLSEMISDRVGVGLTNVPRDWADDARALEAENAALKEWLGFAKIEIPMMRESARLLEAENAELRAKLETEIPRLRVRMFGCSRAPRVDHTTACSIWGDDGRGGTPEGFAPEGFAGLPCNCGALENWYIRQRDEARAAKDAAEARVKELEGALRLARLCSVRGYGLCFNCRTAIDELIPLATPTPEPQEDR